MTGLLFRACRAVTSRGDRSVRARSQNKRWICSLCLSDLAPGPEGVNGGGGGGGWVGGAVFGWIKWLDSKTGLSPRPATLSAAPTATRVQCSRGGRERLPAMGACCESAPRKLLSRWMHCNISHSHASAEPPLMRKPSIADHGD